MRGMRISQLAISCALNNNNCFMHIIYIYSLPLVGKRDIKTWVSETVYIPLFFGKIQSSRVLTLRVTRDSSPTPSVHLEPRWLPIKAL